MNERGSRQAASPPPLTPRQREILEYVRASISESGTSPTVREIGAHFGLSSTNGVHQHLEALASKGYLRKSDYLARGLRVPRVGAAQTRRLPIVGSVPAGLPIDAVENLDGEIIIDEQFLPKGDSFSLRVRGDSMRDAGIHDGDLVVVQKQDTARKGDIVVAIIGQEATVKRYMPDGRDILLQPENPEYPPIRVSATSPELRIAGKVVGLIRRFA